MAIGSKFDTVTLAEINTQLKTPMAPPFPVILVVDDEPVIADTLAAILRQQNYAAFTAYDAASALDLANLIPPHLLISDVVMPGMSGVELAIAMRKNVPDCKVLLFSGQARSLDLLAGARAAGHDFTLLDKPIHPAELLAHISSLQIEQESVA
ncbi:response regulator [Alloacidobacterium sp.]|uniref:response regulator transcription factor n=1 Tax=Alloacidobacterium sp. TaxID=2951999 RepID=UPI002D49F493|nr:response regulator [Alloacidobacterium sp.]HYK38067.1 response regulator [Alloacidobacterium sp.]